jgi:hypothetical protein
MVLFLTIDVGNAAIDQIFRVIDEQSQPTVLIFRNVIIWTELINVFYLFSV